MLTLVFLHESYRSDLPNFPYLTYLDKLYIYSYAACLAIFILFVLDSRNDWSDRPILKINLPIAGKKVLSFEQLAQVLCLLGMGAVAILSWYF